MITTTQQKISDLDCVVVKHDQFEKAKSVVILCHGFGAPAADLVSLSEVFLANESMKDVVFVFPAAPIELDALFDSRAWWMIDIEKIQQLMMQGESREMHRESPELLPERRAALTRVIDHCRVDYDLPASKIVVGGFSQGSMLATDTAIHYDGVLGGLIIWSGALINADNWRDAIRNQQPLKIVQSHGRIDPILPIGCAEDLRDAFRDQEHDLRYLEFHGQHSIPAEAIEMAAQLITEASEGPAL